jgi:hypothetical protein
MVIFYWLSPLESERKTSESNENSAAVASDADKLPTLTITQEIVDRSGGDISH